MIRIGLIGNPNVGKTTLFNKLTGSSKPTGNWGGVTVQASYSEGALGESRIEYVDCPGIYSLSSSDATKDISATTNILLNNEIDLIINVVDINSLARNLYLTSQLLEAGYKVIIAVNMLGNTNHASIDTEELSKLLGCPAFLICANTGKGLPSLVKAISNPDLIENGKSFVEYPESICNIANKLVNFKGFRELPGINSFAKAIWALEDGEGFVDRELQGVINGYQKQLHREFKEDIDIVIADERYYAIDQVIKQCQIKKIDKSKWSDVADYIFMHRYFGVPIFLMVMYFILSLSINLGGVFQEFFSSIISGLYINNTQYLLQKFSISSTLISLISIGIGQGINTIVSFVPVIGIVFFMLSFLEGTGYMARATFVLSRVLSFMRLPSKSFMPMIIGFGCNVPSILATRSIAGDKHRIITILMSPFMSCSARLAVYAVFAGIFFPVGGHNVIFCLYLVGIICALITGMILHKLLGETETQQIFYEFPSYRMPSVSAVAIHAYKRVISFLKGAGKYILLVCLILSVLNDANLARSLGVFDGSILVYLGKLMTPVFFPMGIMETNWQATVGILTGILAKETVLGTLNTLSVQNIASEISLFGFDDLVLVFSNFGTSLLSLPQKMFIFSNGDAQLLSSAASQSLSESFTSASQVFAYLLFLSLYLPCVSTAIVINMELNRFWMIISVIWSVLIGYTVAVIYYQLANFFVNPLQSLIITVSTMALCVLGWMGVFRAFNSKRFLLQA